MFPSMVNNRPIGTFHQRFHAILAAKVICNPYGLAIGLSKATDLPTLLDVESLHWATPNRLPFTPNWNANNSRQSGFLRKLNGFPIPFVPRQSCCRAIERIVHSSTLFLPMRLVLPGRILYPRIATIQHTGSIQSNSKHPNVLNCGYSPPPR